MELERQKLRKYAQSGKLEVDSKCFRISSNKTILGVMGNFKEGVEFQLILKDLENLGME